jgi:predicted acyl esterase
MFGTSWGGTASLQASADAPPALKAVIAVCATHDRYEDDIHHKGGCLLTDSIEWGATLPAILASPPDAATVGLRWREMWRERLENLAFPLETWIREEARGAYWRRGSVTHRRDAISIPVFCVGGWSDRYSNSVMSLVDARPDLVWGLVGPWGHHYPDAGHPGPAVDFQRIALEWWDHWLKRDGNGALDWPRLRLWLREFDPPANALDHRRGSWIEAGPPSRESAPRLFHLVDGGLSEAPAWTRRFRSHPTCASARPAATPAISAASAACRSIRPMTTPARWFSKPRRWRRISSSSAPLNSA